MSRIVCRSMHRSPLRLPAALKTHLRHRSSRNSYSQLIEVVDIDQSPTDSPEWASDIITLGRGIKQLEDAIHSIVVRRSAPYWLPFLPGSSYWVPPRASLCPARSVAEFVEKLVVSREKRNRGASLELLSEDEKMAFTSPKGWPAYSFYIQGTSFVSPIPLHMEVGEIYESDNDEEDNPSNDEDEELDEKKKFR